MGHEFKTGALVWYEEKEGLRFAGVVRGPGPLPHLTNVLLYGSYWWWKGHGHDSDEAAQPVVTNLLSAREKSYGFEALNPPSDSNTPLREGFTQVVVWRSTTLKPENVEDFESWIVELGARCQFLECVERIGSNGQVDLFFAIHDDDTTGRFVIQRLQYGMSWLDDVVVNEPGIYPERIKHYLCWEKNEKDEEE